MRRLLRFTNNPPADGEDQPVTDWSQNLVWFFRVLALFQIAKGLVHWGLLISTSDLSGGEVQTEYLAGNIYFAVLDPVAGVGLWLTSSWGAVLWLLAAVSQIAVSIGFPELFGAMWPLVIAETVAVGFYILLSWKVAQVSDD